MKKAICSMLAFLLAASMLAGCGGAKNAALKYDDQIKEDNGFNENLFYRNDLETCLLYTSPSPRDAS